jgi:hypothetical protein
VAHFAFIDAVVSVNGTDLTDHVNQVSFNYSADELDDTAMGDTHRSRIGGLKDTSVTLGFHSDFAAGEVDATLFPLLGTVVNVVVKPTSGAISTSNPEFTIPALVSQVNPLGNSVGDLAGVSVTWPGAGAVVRDVTP